MALDIERLIISAQARLENARKIAAAFRHRRDIHGPLMQGVFALEDVLFVLHQTAATSRIAEQNHVPADAVGPGCKADVDATPTPPRD